ncbi:MAG TPA: hypothetical protein VL624_00410 [Caldimonas sp.]|jgi:hypothetical protein|nr:hypothetical protein [Caldimonas sp.]
MDRKGLSKIKRAEFLARLEALERLILEQEARIATRHARGWDAKESERRLELLRESHRLYQSALMHLLGADFGAAADDA